MKESTNFLLQDLAAKVDAITDRKNPGNLILQAHELVGGSSDEVEAFVKRVRGVIETALIPETPADTVDDIEDRLRRLLLGQSDQIDAEIDDPYATVEMRLSDGSVIYAPERLLNILGVGDAPELKIHFEDWTKEGNVIQRDGGGKLIRAGQLSRNDDITELLLINRVGDHERMRPMPTSVQMPDGRWVGWIRPSGEMVLLLMKHDQYIQLKKGKDI